MVAGHQPSLLATTSSLDVHFYFRPRCRSMSPSWPECCHLTSSGHFRYRRVTEWVWVSDSHLIHSHPNAETFPVVFCDSITSGLHMSELFENVECLAWFFSWKRTCI